MENVQIILGLLVGGIVFKILGSWLDNKHTGKYFIRAIVSILAGILLSPLGSIFYADFVLSFMDDNRNNISEVRQIDYSDANMRDANINAGNKRETVDNIDLEVNIIRDKYNLTMENINDKVYQEVIYNSKVRAYFDENTLVALQISKGYDEIGYSRIYYYQDNELYFAFVFDGTTENRLYFKSDILFRYIDENGGVHDKGEGITECPFCNWVLDESYRMLNEIRQF